jgi:hypothetical protein
MGFWTWVFIIIAIGIFHSVPQVVATKRKKDMENRTSVR